MAINLTVAALASAVRAGNTTEESAELTRLLTYAKTEISRYLGRAYATAPQSVVNEAAIRLVAYLYDMPNASRGAAFANALRNSGAGRMLLGYRVHRAGTTAEAVDAAQAVMGTTDNPVVGVTIEAGGKRSSGPRSHSHPPRVKAAYPTSAPPISALSSSLLRRRQAMAKAIRSRATSR